MNPPYPLESTAFEPPSPSEFPMIFRGGWGMDIFWNHTMVEISRLTFCYKFHSEQINIKKSYSVSIELNFHEFMYT